MPVQPASSNTPGRHRPETRRSKLEKDIGASAGQSFMSGFKGSIALRTKPAALTVS